MVEARYSSETSVIYQARKGHIPDDNLKERNKFGRLRVGGRIILK
jgi:hypothetical protein